MARRKTQQVHAERERGMALVIVIWAVTFFVVVLSAFAFTMRIELEEATRFAEAAQAHALAEAGIDRVLAELIRANRGSGGIGSELAVADTLGRGSYRAVVRDEEARIALNRVSAEVLARLLEQTGVKDPDLRTEIADAIMDWRDADDLRRLHGAEDAYYQERVPAYHARNGAFRSLEELLLIKGMTREILDGTVRDPERMADLATADPGDRAFGPGEYLGLRPFLSVHGSGRVNVTTASLDVLVAVGMSEAEARAMVEARRTGAGLDQLPAGAGGIAAVGASAIFAVESVGRVADSPVRARIAAVVRNEGLPGQPRYRIIAWKEGV
jgi:general secretion pathway protein K